MNQIERIQEQVKRQGLDGLLLTDEKSQRYAAGFAFTDGAVLVGREAAWLITDSRYIEAAEKAAPPGVTVWLYDRERPLTQQLKQAIRQAGMERLAAEDGKLSHREYLGYEKALGLPLSPAGELMAKLRAAKTEAELQAMRAAQAIAEQALEEVLGLIRPGMTEKELMAELVYRTLRHGSEGNSFDPIVVSGPNTSLPHGVPGERMIQPGDFVTMDFGCLKDGYCSDMTRTVAVGEATEEMRNVYDIVLKAQLAGIAAARAGVTGKVIDAAAREVITQAGYGPYFGHGFGHSLGLDIHESPSASPRGEEPMPVGTVCSAEPGIYLPGRFGVRIEDVMILRPDGCEVITKAPKTLLIL